MRSVFVLGLAIGCGANHESTTDAFVSIDASIDAPAPTGPRTIALTGCGYAYTGPFEIGDSTFRLLVDTGSTPIAVAATGCTTCTEDGATPLYTPGPTAVDTGQQGGATYDGGDISWSGELYTDTVAASTLAGVTVEVGAISTEHDFFDTSCGHPQGILGLSPMFDAAPPDNYLRQIAQAGAADELALQICTASGTLWLDGYDPAAIVGEPQWVSITQGDLYEVPVADVAVAGTSVGVAATSYGNAIVDSGDANVFLPPAAFTAATTMIAASPAFSSRFGAASWFANGACVQLPDSPAALDAALPPITLTLGGGVTVALSATQFYIVAFPTPNEMTYCPGVFSSPGLTDLANVLARAGVVIIDRVNSRLGVAPAATPCGDAFTGSASPPQLRRRPRFR